MMSSLILFQVVVILELVKILLESTYFVYRQEYLSL